MILGPLDSLSSWAPPTYEEIRYLQTIAKEDVVDEGLHDVCLVYDATQTYVIWNLFLNFKQILKQPTRNLGAPSVCGPLGTCPVRPVVRAVLHTMYSGSCSNKHRITSRAIYTILCAWSALNRQSMH